MRLVCDGGDCTRRPRGWEGAAGSPCPVLATRGSSSECRPRLVQGAATPSRIANGDGGREEGAGDQRERHGGRRGRGGGGTASPRQDGDRHAALFGGRWRRGGERGGWSLGGRVLGWRRVGGNGLGWRNPGGRYLGRRDFGWRNPGGRYFGRRRFGRRGVLGEGVVERSIGRRCCHDMRCGEGCGDDGDRRQHRQDATYPNQAVLLPPRQRGHISSIATPCPQHCQCAIGLCG